jgi:hypothetical protein
LCSKADAVGAKVRLSVVPDVTSVPTAVGRAHHRRLYELAVSTDKRTAVAIIIDGDMDRAARELLPVLDVEEPVNGD